MTDHDRGAYTPPTDEALAFDARRQSERRPVPMTLVGSAVVLVVLIVGVAVVYRGGVRGADEAPRPIGQPVVSVKTAPPMAVTTPNGVSPAADGESKSVAAAPSAAPAPTPTPATAAATTAAPAVNAKPAVKVATASPTFAPAPEQPAPRPEPAAKTLALLDQPGQAVGHGRVKVTPPPPAKPVHTASSPDASEVAAAGMTGLAPAHSASSASSPAPFNVATATPKPAVVKPAVAKPLASTPGPKSIDAALANSAQVTGAPVVQIGAFSSAALSDQGYTDVSKIMVGQMVGKAKHVMTVDHGGATLFRTWVSGFSTRAQAEAFCATLKAHSKPCFVKG